MKIKLWNSTILAALIAGSSFISLGEDVPPAASASTSVGLDTTTLQTARPNLTGSVHAKSGEFVAATVFLATAGPKVGTSPFCPSCYADCQKSAKTDAAGNFKITSLDPQLRFQVLAVAKGFKPKYVNKVDPAKGPITVTLDPIELADAAPGNCLRGRIQDAKGKPVVGAVVEAHGIRTRNGGGRWGSLPGVDPLAVTDESGDFLITSQKPFDQMDVRVSARGFANKNFTELASGASVHELTLTEGAAVRGRVLFNGQPVTNVTMGVVSVNRDMEHFTGNFDIGTDSDGRFLFVSLPPDVEYYIYGGMDSFKKLGAIPLKTIHAGKDGEVTDIGNLVVAPAHRLTGRVMLADGAMIPAKTRLLVSRENAWDNVQVMLPPDGKFDVAGVPAETIGLSLRLPGYRVSGKNASLDRLNPFQLIGRVTGDVTNLIFLMEKGGDLTPDYTGDSSESDRPQNKPLRGAEAGVDRSYQLAVTGRVTDKQTGEPLAHFKVIPGRSDLTWNRNTWDQQNQSEGTNGVFSVFVDKKWPQPILKVQAEGYLPASALLRPLEQTNADFILQLGTGPVGQVVTTNGQPIAKADVLLICDDSEQAGFDYEGHLNSWRNKELITQTDTNGAFHFKPQLGMKSIAVAAPNGFTRIAVEQLQSDSHIVLQPFGTITGVLHRPTGLGTNEDLDLSFVESDNQPYQRFNLANHTVTDGNGRFVFDRVPAGKLLISYRVKMNGNGWMAPPLQPVELAPGQTLEVDIKAKARQVEDRFTGQAPPAAVRIPGEEIKGIVLLPDGKPAADAQVAIKVKGKYLALGRAAFKASEAWQDGSIVRAGPDGGFTLPMYVDAQTVIAVHDKGYVQVPVADLKHSPQITLQPWGRVEGTLRRGHHAATNEIIVLSVTQIRPSQIRSSQPGGTNSFAFTNTSPERFDPVIYDYSDFQSRTDEQGRFIITYIPPGEHTLAQLVPVGDRTQMHQRLGNITVAPGETVRVNYGGDERAVSGKVALVGTNVPSSFSQARATLHAGASFRMIEQLKQAKTQEERMALFQSEDFQQAMSNPHEYSIRLANDGSFKTEAIPAGKYEMAIDFSEPSQSLTPDASQAFMSPQQLVVPPATSTNDDSVVDLGTIELKKLSVADFQINQK